MKKTFVSGADANYYPLLREWVFSLRAFDESKNFDICIMDTGLTPQQHDEISGLVTTVVKPDWPCDLPAHKTKGKEYLKSCVCRPFLPQIFPDYDLYFWMDADTWVQNWDAVEMFVAGADKSHHPITLTAQVDRAYPRGGARVKWWGRIPAKIRGFYFSNARKAYGFKIARDLLPYHVLLAGAFALHKDADLWSAWQENVVTTMQKGKVFTAEQLSLGYLCYLQDYPYEILPAWVHWLCEFKPLWNAQTNRFVEPFLPHNEIGILHISGWDAMRLDRSVETEFQTMDGGVERLSYRYRGHDGTADLR